MMRSLELIATSTIMVSQDEQSEASSLASFDELSNEPFPSLFDDDSYPPTQVPHPSRPQSMINSGNRPQMDTGQRTADGRYVCRVCGRHFANRFSLTGHYKSHYGYHEKPYACADCGLRYTSPSNLHHHRAKKCAILRLKKALSEEEGNSRSGNGNSSSFENLLQTMPKDGSDNNNSPNPQTSILVQKALKVIERRNWLSNRGDNGSDTQDCLASSSNASGMKFSRQSRQEAIKELMNIVSVPKVNSPTSSTSTRTIRSPEKKVEVTDSYSAGSKRIRRDSSEESSPKRKSQEEPQIDAANALTNALKASITSNNLSFLLQDLQSKLLMSSMLTLLQQNGGLVSANLNQKPTDKVCSSQQKPAVQNLAQLLLQHNPIMSSFMAAGGGNLLMNQTMAKLQKQLLTGSTEDSTKNTADPAAKEPEKKL
ncbi:hypothetical protein Ciccas_005318 [Cichlidogyrus casuarinus]|uniref:C2H2-type domain-containing protein n=1 Tax=Cichlidogyrus casuarinus TaxID=1844966 RepID=A0ABD2QCL4_9PLAT